MYLTQILIENCSFIMSIIHLHFKFHIYKPKFLKTNNLYAFETKINREIILDKKVTYRLMLILAIIL